MLAIERRNFILEKLQDEKKVIVSELSRRFQVSEETIRRDLEKLCQEGYAVKSYGGAVINEELSIDLPFNVRKKRNVKGKQAMAKIVDTLIEDGDQIFLDASSTAVFIAKAIKHKKNLTVVTNAIEVLIELSDVPNWEVISTGGTLKEGYLALFGPGALSGIGAYNAKKLFFSCKGLDMKKGVTDSCTAFCQTKQAMLQSAAKSFLVADHTKFDSVNFSKISDIEQIHTLVTDQRPAPEWLELLNQKQIACLYPPE